MGAVRRCRDHSLMVERIIMSIILQSEPTILPTKEMDKVREALEGEEQARQVQVLQVDLIPAEQDKEQEEEVQIWRIQSLLKSHSKAN